MRTKTLAAVTALLATTGLVLPSTAAADRTKPPTDTSAAPASWSDDVLPTFELYGQFEQPRTATDEAHLSRTSWGYRFVSGAGDNDLTVTDLSGRLLFHDTTLTRWTKIPRSCKRVTVEVGQAAVCNVPAKFASEMFLELWPRLGDDTIDTSALGAQFRSWVLTDAGEDVVRTGAGDDFVNTASGSDVAWGGAGDDWIRMGADGNTAYGEAGDDKLVGGEQDDTLYGGDGNDSVGGLAGDDVLHGGAGDDLLAGKVGWDAGYVEGRDKLRNIDVVH